MASCYVAWSLYLNLMYLSTLLLNVADKYDTKTVSLVEVKFGGCVMFSD